MGPELGSKSAGRCSYRQRSGYYTAAIRNQIVRAVCNALQILGFMDRKQLEQDGCSGSTFTDKNQIIFAITTGLSVSVGLTFAMHIVSIGLQFFYITIFGALKQSVTIAVVLLLLRVHSHTHYGGEARFRQPLCASRKVTRFYPALVGQSRAPFKLSHRPSHRGRDAWGGRKPRFRGGEAVFLASTLAKRDHQTRSDDGADMGLAGALKGPATAGATLGGGCVSSPTVRDLQNGAVGPVEWRGTQSHNTQPYSTQLHKPHIQSAQSSCSMMSDSDTNGGRNVGTPPPMGARVIGATMPRPGQPGAMKFDGKNISEFLEEWNIECEDFGLGDAQRCARFPNYCTPEIKDTVKILPGYITTDWALLQSDVKRLYWPHDKPRNTMAALDKLVKEAPTMDLNVYILKYTSVSDALVAAHALSTLDRVARLLDGLSEDLRRKVIRYCTKQGWKLSTQDSGEHDPEYDQIKLFILVGGRKTAIYRDSIRVRGCNSFR